MIASTPQPPYYAVIFTSLRTNRDEGYGETALLMEKMASEQPGFLGMESAREGLGITVSYWESLEAISHWKKNAAHSIAQQRGIQEWYTHYKTRICKVERDYDFHI